MRRVIKITESQLRKVINENNNDYERYQEMLDLIERNKMEKIKKLVNKILNENLQPTDTDYEGNREPVISIMYDFDNGYSLSFDYKTDFISYPWWDEGGWDEPPGGGGGEWDIIKPGKLRVWNGEEKIYDGDDFTNFISLKFNNNNQVEPYIYETFDERIQEIMNDIVADGPDGPDEY